MCLAIPAKVTKIGEDNLATVDILGATREISLDLTPSAEVGSYVLVHAGFAIEVVDEQFAQETIDLIKEFPELAAEEVNGAQYLENASGVVSEDGEGAASTRDASPSEAEIPSNAGDMSMQQMLSKLASEM